jgi:hypothetical protein
MRLGAFVSEPDSILRTRQSERRERALAPG